MAGDRNEWLGRIKRDAKALIDKRVDQVFEKGHGEIRIVISETSGLADVSYKFTDRVK